MKNKIKQKSKNAAIAVGHLVSDGVATLKSAMKLLALTRKCRISPDAEVDKPLIILGNGPSLRQTIDAYSHDVLPRYPLMAVNFAANAPEFTLLRPRYYILADPLFFASSSDKKVAQLWENFARLVEWRMTIYVPMKHVARVRLHNPMISVAGFNFIGLEGTGWFTRAAFDAGRGMPRPRNVLIPALMVGIKLGYKNIYITGADHSWTKTLDVDDENRVVTVQPHFYRDDEHEARRVALIYENIHMHDILESFSIAFRSYFAVEKYARRRGIDIYNATPGSFIDAFRRRLLPQE